MTTINERIRQIRQNKQLTQKQFAQMLGISREHLCRIESGKEKPSEQMLLLISIIFGNIDTTWLLNGVGENMLCNDDEELSLKQMNSAIKSITNTIKTAIYNQSTMVNSLIIFSKLLTAISRSNEEIVLFNSIIESLEKIVKKSANINENISIDDYNKLEKLKSELINDVNLFIMCN